MLNGKQIAFLKKAKELKGCGVYEIWSPSNKVYIGQTTNFFKRFMSYFSMQCKAQRKLYNSFLKYGADKHDFKIVLVEYTWRYDQKRLDETEQRLMDFYRNHDYELLNLREAGHRGKFSEDSKQRLSEVKKGKRLGEDNPNWGKGCFGEANGMFGKNHSAKSRQKILDTKLERYGEVWAKNAALAEEKRLESIKNWKNKVSKNMTGSKPTPRKVVQLSESGEYINLFDSMYKAATAIEIHPSHISKSVRKNKFAPTTRFRFMYKEVYEDLVITKLFIETGLIHHIAL